MKSNVKTLKQVIESMPFYGELREVNKQLTFGQYLAILKRWFEDVKSELFTFEHDLRLFVAIHENQEQKISPELFRKEILP